jgi:predicted GIY-YIG superfamily endonuclease
VLRRRDLKAHSRARTIRAVTPAVDHPAMKDGPISLYRLHDAKGGLLYVGIAGNPGRRFQEHAATKAWWEQVCWVHVEHYPTRPEAEAAETKAIKTERPKYNVAQVTSPLSARLRSSSLPRCLGDLAEIR